ncbi:MAG: T9SS type A sorting domain-containing protein [Saprospiraceae bacterium]
MKKITNLFALLFLFVAATSIAQRYQAPVFSEVSTNVDFYGSNFTVITLQTPLMHTARQPLAMRVYQPVGDVETKRPLIIYLHTGNFLPFPNNSGCYGTINDSSCVEFATRLAKMGYVVAVADYRLGWNPLATTELSRRFTLINAAYRGVQDARTCIRYFRKSADVGGNPYKIDPEKIILWGQGTGGYISLACATLNNYSDILNTSEPGKFMLNAMTPMVIQQYNGDIYGNPPAPQQHCLVDAAYNSFTGIPIGDTLCSPNHVGYSSDFAMAVNMGGALADKWWLDAQTPPIVSFHVLTDPFAPCGDGLVVVPLPPDFPPVVNVTGSCGLQQIIEDDFHTNDIFKKSDDCNNNAFVQKANSMNGGRAGFYPFYNTPPSPTGGTQSGPWEWAAVPPAAGNCNTNSVTSRAYTDTIIGYAAPLACRALDICCLVGTEDLVKSNIDLKIAPNPAANEVTLTVPSEYLMQGIELFNANGQLVRTMYGINHSSAILDRGSLPNGIYTAKVYFAEGVMARMIVFE